MVTELMQCDLYDALGQETLLEQLSWRKRGVQIALDIARGLSCECPLKRSPSLESASSCGRRRGQNQTSPTAWSILHLCAASIMQRSDLHNRMNLWGTSSRQVFPEPWLCIEAHQPLTSSRARYRPPRHDGSHPLRHQVCQRPAGRRLQGEDCRCPTRVTRASQLDHPAMAEAKMVEHWTKDRAKRIIYSLLLHHSAHARLVCRHGPAPGHGHANAPDSRLHQRHLVSTAGLPKELLADTQ